MAQCSGIKRDGGRCGSQAIRHSAYCFHHHPDFEQQRKDAAIKGGKRGGRGRSLGEIARINSWLEEIARDVIEGRLDHKRGAVAGQILSYVLGGIRISLEAREQEELVGRLETLEESIQEQGRSQPWGA